MSIGKSGVKHFEFENKKNHFARPNVGRSKMAKKRGTSLMEVPQISKPPKKSKQNMRLMCKKKVSFSFVAYVIDLTSNLPVSGSISKRA